MKKNKNNFIYNSDHYFLKHNEVYVFSTLLKILQKYFNDTSCRFTIIYLTLLDKDRIAQLYR